jgi:hypothetical protein
VRTGWRGRTAIALRVLAFALLLAALLVGVYLLFTNM